MFSQYSWGDFFKVTIPLIVLYYAWVAWAYYREDIRDWISNGGKSNALDADAVDEELESDDESIPSFLVTKDYRDHSASVVPPVEPPDHGQPNSAPAYLSPAMAPGAGVSPQQPTESVSNQPDIFTGGPDLGEQPEDHLALSMLGLQADNPLEQPLDLVLEAAQRVTVEVDGVVVARDQDDQPAAALAAAINNQRARDEFADMSFTR